MGGCSIGFSREGDQAAFDLYGVLIKGGLTCEEMDQGYRLSNYAGKHCPNVGESSCTVGVGDGKVEALEVYEHIFSNHLKYKKLMKETFGRSVSWTFDETDGAGPILKVVDRHIKNLASAIAGLGFAPGSEGFKERMGVALCYLAMFPKKENSEKFEKALGSTLESYTQELSAMGLHSYRADLHAEGGLGVFENFSGYAEVKSALDSYNSGEGNCMARAKILFALLERANATAGAGLEFDFVHVPRESYVKSNIPSLRANINPMSFNVDHVCIGLKLKGGLRLLDLFSSKADFEGYYPLSPRQYYSIDMSIEGIHDHAKGDAKAAIRKLSSAINLDAQNKAAIFSMGIRLLETGDIPGAKSHFESISNIDPDDVKTHLLQAGVFLAHQKYGEFCESLSKYLQKVKGDISPAVSYLEQLISSTRWQLESEKKIAAIFEKDTGFPAPRYETHSALGWAFWKAGYRGPALALFKEVFYSRIPLDRKLSPESRGFIKELIRCMPRDMAEDADFSPMLKAIDEKMNE